MLNSPVLDQSLHELGILSAVIENGNQHFPDGPKQKNTQSTSHESHYYQIVEYPNMLNKKSNTGLGKTFKRKFCKRVSPYPGWIGLFDEYLSLPLTRVRTKSETSEHEVIPETVSKYNVSENLTNLYKSKSLEDINVSSSISHSTKARKDIYDVENVNVNAPPHVFSSSVKSENVESNDSRDMEDVYSQIKNLNVSCDS